MIVLELDSGEPFIFPSKLEMEADMNLGATKDSPSLSAIRDVEKQLKAVQPDTYSRYEKIIVKLDQEIAAVSRRLTDLSVFYSRYSDFKASANEKNASVALSYNKYKDSKIVMDSFSNTKQGRYVLAATGERAESVNRFTSEFLFRCGKMPPSSTISQLQFRLGELNTAKKWIGDKQSTLDSLD